MKVLVAVVCAALAATPEPPVLPDLSGAEPQVRTVIEEAHAQVVREPGAAAPWGRYASLLGVHEFVAESVSAYQVAGQLDPGSFRWPYLQGVRLAEENPDAALASFERALELNDEYAPLHLRYASLMLRRGHPDAALRSYERAVELDRLNPAAHAGLGQRLLAIGQQDRALRHLRRALRLDPQCRAALTGLVAYYSRTGDRSTADRYARKAAAAPKAYLKDEIVEEVNEQSIGTAAVLTRVWVHMQAGRRGEARKELERLIDANPDSAPGRTRLGELYLEDGRLTPAIEQFRAALAVDPTLVKPRLGLAGALSRAELLQEAQREYQAVLADHPTSAVAHEGLGAVLARMGRIEESADHFRRATEFAPDSRRARVGYAQVLLARGRFEAVLDALAPLLDEAEEPWDEWTREAAATTGVALARLGRNEEALELLTQALAIDPARGQLRHTLATVLIALRRDAEAAATLRRGLILDPADGNMAITLATLMATSPDDDVRDGARAVRVAEQWVASTERRSVIALDALACAYAEVGRFDEAVSLAEEALEKARAQDLKSAREIADRLETFRQGRPHRLHTSEP